MRRIVLWGLSTLSAVVLLFGYHTSTTTTLASTPPSATEGTAGSAFSGSARSGTSGAAPSKSGGATIAGSVVSTQWGPVQVQITTKKGTITDVEVLQYPSGNPRDSEINSYALPILVQETLDQQSAEIDMVSGATVTSTGYLQSLQSALDQANS